MSEYDMKPFNRRGRYRRASSIVLAELVPGRGIVVMIEEKIV